jgi:hypothetical protein
MHETLQLAGRPSSQLKLRSFLLGGHGGRKANPLLARRKAGIAAWHDVRPLRPIWCSTPPRATPAIAPTAIPARPRSPARRCSPAKAPRGSGPTVYSIRDRFCPESRKRKSVATDRPRDARQVANARAKARLMWPPPDGADQAAKTVREPYSSSTVPALSPLQR